jgi:hypothetical protein
MDLNSQILEGDPMSETQTEVTPEYLNALKTAHDCHATVVHLLTCGRFQFAHEEFQQIANMVAFYKQLAADCLAKVEAIEPPIPAEPKKPYIVDVPDKGPLENASEPA